MNQNRWDENIFVTSNWLYDQRIVFGSRAFIHIPLIYLTKMPVLQEVYANALVVFPRLIGLDDILNPVIVDGSVVMFPVHDFERFRYKAYETIINSFQKRKQLVRLCLLIKKWLPVLCLKAEKQYLLSNKPSPILLKRLHKMISLAIAINLANPFVEILFVRANRLYANDQTFKDKLDTILWPKIFSHMAYFSSEFETLKHLKNQGTLKDKHLYDFCWQTAFLENPVGDGSNLEDPANLAENIDCCSKVNVTGMFSYLCKNHRGPNINFDPSGITDRCNNADDTLEELLYLLRCLQVNEEVRHYWALRAVRLFRYIAIVDEQRHNWNLKDYERYCQK